MLQQFGLDPGGIGVALVDLVDRDDHRHLRRLGVGDGFHRLGHDAVIGGHHQNDQIGDLGAAGAHRREGGMAGRIQESDLLAGLQLHLVGADMLGDAAGFARYDIGLAQGVEQ